MSIRIKKALLITLSALLALSVAVCCISLAPKTVNAVTVAADKTVTATAYTVGADDSHNNFVSNPSSNTMKSFKNSPFNMTLFSNTVKTCPEMVFNFSESVNAEEYAVLKFKAYFWANNYAKYAPVTVKNLDGDKTSAAEIWGQQARSVDAEKLWVTINVDDIKNSSGKVEGFKMIAPEFTDDMSWFMVSDFTFVASKTVSITEAFTFTGDDMTNKTPAKDDGAVAEWKTVLGMKKFSNTFSTADSKFYVGFDSINASEYTSVSFKALIWAEGGACSYADTEIYKADNTFACNTKVAYSWMDGSCASYTPEQLNVTIPTADLKDDDGKVSGFIIRNSVTKNISKWFMISELTFAKSADVPPVSDTYAISASNVTFKMGGTYGMNVYYDLDVAWTNDGGAGWIVNATKAKGDVNMKLVMSEENVTGTGAGSLFGIVRMPNLDSNWATSKGFYNYFTNGANHSFIVGNWADHKEFLVAYDADVPGGTIYVGTAQTPVTSTLFTGKGATNYTGAKTWEYFGYGWANRGYSVKTKIQIYDDKNNDLGVNASLWDRTSYSCILTGKVGETISFTAKTPGVPTVTTAGGTNVEVTAAGANGVYSFVMPAEAVTVAAAPEAETEVTFTVNGETNKTEKITWNEENFVAAIPSVSIADTKVVGYEYEGKLYKTGAALFAAIGTPAEAITVNIVALHLETVDGAEVRASGTAGLRFTSAVAKSAHVSAYGMILTVKTNVDNSGENDGVGLGNFTKENLDTAGYKYLETNSSESDFKSYEQDGNVIFSLVLTNIRDNHRDLQYVVRTYVTVSYEGGETVTCYSDVDFENNARSAHDVATSAIENKDINGLTKEQIAFLEENYLKKA